MVRTLIFQKSLKMFYLMIFFIIQDVFWRSMFSFCFCRCLRTFCFIYFFCMFLFCRKCCFFWCSISCIPHIACYASSAYSQKGTCSKCAIFLQLVAQKIPIHCSYWYTGYRAKYRQSNDFFVSVKEVHNQSSLGM